MLRGNILGTTLRGGLGLNGTAGGWVREVRANDANPALSVRQDGAGKLLSLLQGATERAYFSNSGTLVISVSTADRALYIAQANTGWGIESDAVARFRGQSVSHAALRPTGLASLTEAIVLIDAPPSWGGGNNALLSWIDTDASTRRVLFDIEGLLKLRNYAALPTAGASYRSKLAVVEGAAGVTDAYYICQKLADDTFAWKQISVV